MEDCDGLEMTFDDFKVRTVARHWRCDCGGEFICAEGVSNTFETKWRHSCDKCNQSRWAEKTYPGIEHLTK